MYDVKRNTDTSARSPLASLTDPYHTLSPEQQARLHPQRFQRERHQQVQRVALQRHSTEHQARERVQAFFQHDRTPGHQGTTWQRQVAAPVLQASALRAEYCQARRGEVLQRLVDGQLAQRLGKAHAELRQRQADLAPRPASAYPQRDADGQPSMPFLVGHFNDTLQRARAQQGRGDAYHTEADLHEVHTGAGRVMQRYRQQLGAARPEHLADAFEAIASPRDRAFFEPLALRHLEVARRNHEVQAVKGILGQRQEARLTVQRALDELESTTREALQRELSSEAHDLAEQETRSPDFARKLEARRGAGQPLPEPVRQQLTLGLNIPDEHLRGVRVHTDDAAHRWARGLQAVAFTTGKDIFFQRGKYDPNSHSGWELLGHEVTHTVQQSQGKVSGQGVDPDAGLEQEARQAGARLAAQPRIEQAHPWKPAQLQANPHAPGQYTPQAALQRAQTDTVNRLYYSAFTALQRTPDFTLQRVFDPVDWAKNKAQGGVRGALSNLPGYQELCLVFGKDLVTGKAMTQNPNAILDALASWVPGPLRQVIQHLRSTNSIPKAWAWFQAELRKLNLGAVPGEVLGAVKALNLNKARAALTRPVSGLQRLVAGSARQLARIALEAVAAGLGPAAQQVVSNLKKSGDVILKVLQNPGAFASNLAKAVTGGFQRFASNSGTHLHNGLGQWLTGSSGLTFPVKLDVAGVFMTVMTVLGLTYQNFRSHLVKQLGNTKVQQAEQTVSLLQNLKSNGLHAAEELQGEKGNVGQATTNEIKDYVKTSMIQAAVTKLVTMFIPGGGFANALISAFDTVKFLMQEAGRIGSLVTNVVNSVGAIAAGNISAAVGGVERSLAMSIPLALSFFSRIFKVGNIGQRVKGFIQKRKAALDRTVQRVMHRASKAIAGALGKRPGQAKDVAANVKAKFNGVFKKHSFKAGREQHSIWFQARNGQVQMIFASTPREATVQLDYLEAQVQALKDPAQQSRAMAALLQARTLAVQTNVQLATVQNERDLEKVSYDPRLEHLLRNVYEVLQEKFEAALDAHALIETPIRYDRREQFFRFRKGSEEYTIYVSRHGFPQFGPYSKNTVQIDMKGNRSYTMPDGDFAKANLKAGYNSSTKHSNHTWHHHEDRQTMQLVPRPLHDKFRHSGGVNAVQTLGELTP